MSINHSPELHRNLIDRIPTVTGRALPEWFEAIDNGPAFTRPEERVNWLADEHSISHGYAAALVHEHTRHRMANRY